MDDLTAERKTAFPEVHHFLEVAESIAIGQRLSFAWIQLATINPNADETIESALLFLNADILHIRAHGSHDQPRVLSAKAGIKMQGVARLVRIFSVAANRMTLAPTANVRFELPLEVIETHCRPPCTADAPCLGRCRADALVFRLGYGQDS